MSHCCDSGEQCACVLALDTRTTPVLARVRKISREPRVLCRAGLVETKEAVWCERDPVPKCRHGVGRVAAGGARGSVACALRAAPAEALHSAGSRALAPVEAVVNFVSLSHPRRFTYRLDYQILDFLIVL